MKTSKLIEELQKSLRTNGDLDVHFIDYSDCGCGSMEVEDMAVHRIKEDEHTKEILVLSDDDYFVDLLDED